MKQHLYNLSEAHLPQRSMVTIGVFDGVHRGHQYLVKRLVEEARASDRLSVVLTFFPHPDIVLRGLQGRYYLTTAEQKAHLLMDLGVNVVVTHTFNEQVRQIRAADFVDQLVGHLNMEELWVGSDFAMGYKREGNVPFLKEQGTQKNLSVHDIDLIQNGGASAISSTAIRDALQVGQVEEANSWLGRAFSVSGEVVHGEKRGRLLGFPTANMAVWDEQVIPANGIYASWARLGNERFMAATNVGVRPHFEGQIVTVEPYLLDFDRDIYGEQLEITFETRLRPEAKFNSLQDLIDQIGRDVDATRAYLETQQS